MPTSPRGPRWADRLRLDWSHPHPRPASAAVLVALVVAVAGSLVADRLLVALGTHLFPSVTGYGHFGFSDYGTLTVIGVVVAGSAWPVVCRVSPEPRWLYLRLAVVVTVVLWVPDLYLLVDHQPGRAVCVLMVMHLAVAVVTYQAMVRLAPPRAASAAGEGTARSDAGGSGVGAATVRYALWLAALVGVEFVLGIVTLVSVPTGRPSGWWPDQGRLVYLAHALVGLPLAVLAVLYLARVRESTRLHRLSGWIGAVGVAVAGLGGLLAVVHPLRLVGVGLMLAGPLTAGFGYLIPWFDRLSDDAPGEPGGEEPAAL
jgi:hypothetical protein